MSMEKPANIEEMGQRSNKGSRKVSRFVAWIKNRADADEQSGC